jgi:hypothetical protein
MHAALSRCLSAGLLGVPLAAQTYNSLTEARANPTAYRSVFQVEAGAIGAQADTSDPDLGLDDDVSWDGRVYWRNGNVGSRRSVIEAYGGRDGFVANWQDAKLIGDETITRVELRARPWMFYRDGFYDRRDRLRANGFYEGSDYEAYVGFGKDLREGLFVEFGPYYRGLDFANTTYTPATVDTFRLPDDHSAYGGRLYVESADLQFDRRRIAPRTGYVLSFVGEREWNDSDAEIGTDLYETRLAAAYWRVRGRLEWYIPASDNVCWEVFAHGGWQDEKDRLQNSEGQRPLGNQWGDGRVRMRWHLSNSLWVAPYGQLQYSRTLTEDGFGSSKNFFLGGGVESTLNLGEAVALRACWSYLDNDNMPSIRIDRDVHGEQMFYVGMMVRIGAVRR